MISKLYKKVISHIESRRKISYSQCGEDLVVDFLLAGEKNIFYVDIGVNDPRKINNTYKLYKERKARGIIVEPNPDFKKKIERIRKMMNIYRPGLLQKKLS